MVEPDEVENLEFGWGKKRGIGGKKKDVQFYESFTYDGVEYTLYDCVYLYKDGEVEPYIGKLIKIWEHSDKIKRVKVLWFFRPNEILKYLEGVERALENELFLASGEGAGLANVNPLEAIAGKCNVICISKDSRNPQPSDEVLQRADFVFYRTFDVGHCKILDKIDGKIAGIEVKYMFNRTGCQNSSDVLKVDPDQKDVSGNAASSDQAVILSKLNASEEHKNLKTDGVSTDSLARENEDSKASLIKQKSSLGEKHASRGGVESIPDENKDRGNEELKVPLAKQKSSLGEKVASRLPIELDEMATTADRQENISDDKTASRSKDNPDRRESKVEKVPDGQVEVAEKGESRKHSGELDNRPHKKAKLDGAIKVCDDKNKSSMQHLSRDFEGKEAKTVVPDVTPRDKSKLAKDPYGTEKGPYKKLELDDKLSRHSNDKFPKAFSRRPSLEDKKTDHQVLEVTRRPDADRSRWFRGLPWEERMQTANEQRTLVLLQNLDPAYTSAEVEDIVWHGFKETCTAKMIQKTAFSSPHSGQAFAVFKTREAAEKVVTKLDEGCLLLSNGRPLVGSIANPCFPKKQSTYFGHLVIDKLKHQMQREMKEAVSTSHCSQPNTLEYDMAMEWCLLQERSDRSWEKLYKKQGWELKKLAANFKSK